MPADLCDRSRHRDERAALKWAGRKSGFLKMADLVDEIDLAILHIYDDAAEQGLTARQARMVLRERIEIMAAVIDETLAIDYWPDPVSTAVH